MKVYAVVENGKPVVDENKLFLVAKLKKSIGFPGVVVIKMDLSKLEKGGSLPEGVTKCFAIVSNEGNFILDDGSLLVAKTKGVLEPMASESEGETVVRAVLY